MKKTKILYWIFNGLLCFLMLGSAIPDILMDPIAIKGMHEDLGYPVYFIPFIGVAKALGVVAILVPGNPRLKEWVYAGFAFDLAGATYSILAAGKPVTDWIFMLLPLTLLVFAYVFHHKKLRTRPSVQGRGVSGPVLAGVTS